VSNHDESRLRVPPQAVEAEQSILGSMMLDNRCIDDVCEILRADNFYRQDHKKIFNAIDKLNSFSSAADVVTVSDFLTKSGELDSVGGLSYLGELAKNTPQSGAVKSYCDVVIERWALRTLIESANDTIQQAYQPQDLKPSDIADQLAAKIDSLEEGVSKDKSMTASELVPTFIDELEKRFNSDSEIIGYSTGFPLLDKRFSGLERGKVYVIAGRPKMGKSTLMLNLATNAAVSGLMSHIFTMEMPKLQVTNKIISNLANVPYDNIRNPKLLEKDQWSMVTQAATKFKELKMVIDDQPRLSVNQIRSRIRKSIRAHGEGIAFIDYLQLMYFGDGKSKADAIGDVTSRLKEIAKTFDIPVVLLSQLNRSVETRPNKRPIASDLRDSGSIEQDADAVTFVYRHEVYEPDTEQKGVAEIITDAIRDGEAGTDRLIFNGSKQRFEHFENPYFGAPQ